VETSLGHGTLLKTAWVCAKDVSGLIRLQIATALSRVEVSEALGAALASIDILSLERCRLKAIILPRWREHIRLRASNVSNVDDCVIFFSMLVHRCQRVSDAAGFENLMSNITVIHLRDLEWALTHALNMARLGNATFDSVHAHNVPSRQVGVLILDGSGTVNVINILLVTHEARWLRVDEGHALKFVVRV
jgi:hypothetical protein